MPECDVRGCPHPADVTVVYADPEELVAYCMLDGVAKFRSESNARRVERGVADALEAEDE